MEYCINLQNLTYSYNNKFKALDNITVQVPKGSVYGFLGPNGAGKSTTMRMISGIMPDETNAINIFGEPLNAQKPNIYKRIGCLVEQPVLYSHLTAKDHLELISTANNLDKNNADNILKMVGLSDAKNLKVKRFSLGMKQRLAIGLCLVKNPELLLLDEPVNGLDPYGIQEVRELLLQLNKEHGITIFISSHLLSEIEKMCSHICIINKGKIHFEGTMPELKQKFETTPLSIYTDNTTAISLPEYTFTQLSDKIVVQITSKKDIPQIVTSLAIQGINIYEVKQEGNLESWFMDLLQ